MENVRNWRRIRFAGNLKALIEGSGLNRKQFAEKVDVPYPWLQRATTGGITRLDRRGREHLDRIAKWFGLAEADRLWDRDFVAPPPWNSREARATRIADELRRLLVERGEEAEPLKTIIRLIGEVNEGVRADDLSRSPIDLLRIDGTGREDWIVVDGPASWEGPAGPAPQLDSEEWTTSHGSEQPSRMIEEARAIDLANRTGSASTSDPVQQGHAPGKPTGAVAIRLAAIHRRNTKRRWEEIRRSRISGPTPSGSHTYRRCIECWRPSEGRCWRCGEPLCDDCLALGRACEGCTPDWDDALTAESQVPFCGYCGREEVTTACHECGERLCPECAERGAYSGDDFFCEGCTVPIPSMIMPSPGIRDSGEDEEGFEDE